MYTSCPGAVDGGDPKGAAHGKGGTAGSAAAAVAFGGCGAVAVGKSCDYHWSRSWPLAAVLNDPV